MAVWVNVNRAANFAEVKKVYKRAGWGQGAYAAGQKAGQSQTAGTPTSAPRGFLETVRAAVSASFANGAALPAWIRKAPSAGGAQAAGTGQDWQTVQVDVTAIPGVRPLRVNGRWNGTY